jgi:hypothetical protein
LIRRSLSICFLLLFVRPILCLFSSASSGPQAFEEIAHRTDTVLNVNDIDRYSTTLGSQVTKRVIQNGMHDLVLSREPVRSEVFAAMFDWLEAHAEKGLGR